MKHTESFRQVQALRPVRCCGAVACTQYQGDRHAALRYLAALCFARSRHGWAPVRRQLRDVIPVTGAPAAAHESTGSETVL
jgi:hypothetical protein